MFAQFVALVLRCSSLSRSKLPTNSGCICLNGAAARLFQPGDQVIIMAYAGMTPEEAREYRAKVVFPDAENRLA